MPDLTYCRLDDQPCIISRSPHDICAFWVPYGAAHWEEIHVAEAWWEGRVLTRVQFERIFPHLPPFTWRP